MPLRHSAADYSQAGLARNALGDDVGRDLILKPGDAVLQRQFLLFEAAQCELIVGAIFLNGLNLASRSIMPESMQVPVPRFSLPQISGFDPVLLRGPGL